MKKLKRILKHVWLDESDTRREIPAQVLARLTARVSASESLHRGEVRIFVEAGLPLSYLWRGAVARERALALFGKLRVWDTEDNNGVLIYLLLADQAIELVADRGLTRHVAPSEWQATTQRLGLALRDGLYEEGLLQAVDELTAVLAKHFPQVQGQVNVNELPDEPQLG